MHIYYIKLKQRGKITHKFTFAAAKKQTSAATWQPLFTTLRLTS